METSKTNHSCTVEMVVAYFIISILVPVPA